MSRTRLGPRRPCWARSPRRHNRPACSRRSNAYSASPEEAEAAMRRFGKQARADGYRHADSMVSVAELAKALGAPSPGLLDVRPADRFALGHIPGARRLYRATTRAVTRFPACRERATSSSSCFARARRSQGQHGGALRRRRARAVPAVVDAAVGGRLRDARARWRAASLEGGGPPRGRWRRARGRSGRRRACACPTASHPALAGDLGVHRAAPGHALLDTRSEIEFERE